MLNKNFSPMLLSEIDKPFNDKNYIFELKYDGIRVIIKIKNNKLKIYSRNKRDITYLFPEIKINTKNNVIFDGEIVLFDKNKPSFFKLQERLYLKDKNKIEYNSINNKVVFIVFDILYENKDITNLSLIKRKEILSKYKDTDIFIKTFYIEEKGIELFKKVKRLKLEGIVAKKKDSTYKINTRSKEWIKIKNFKEEQFLIVGYKSNKSIYTINLCLGEIRNNKLYYVGTVVLNKKHKLYNKIINSKIINNPFIDFKEDYNYIKLDIKVNVIYIERTDNNHLRHAVIKD